MAYLIGCQIYGGGQLNRVTTAYFSELPVRFVG